MHRTRIAAALFAVGCAASAAYAQPKVIIISLDGATPRFVEAYLADGTLNPNEGLGLLKSKGIFAQRNVTITPSLTAVAHIAIATGSSAANNDILANSFHPIASPFTSNISGFGAPIGGYAYDGITPAAHSDSDLTAQPLWLALQGAGKQVVTATWPGGDGVNVTLPGRPGIVVQPASKRTVGYTVPFGAFAGPFFGTNSSGARGFVLAGANFVTAPTTTTDQLTAAGKTFFGTVRQYDADPATPAIDPLETATVGGVTYNIQVAALDTTNDNTVNYDTLVFFDQTNGIKPGPFALPSTGPAYVKPSVQISEPFYFEGSSNKAGARFSVTNLAPDLSAVRFVRTSANFIPRNAPVIADVDDINNNVGFWQPQPDFRLTQRVGVGFATYPEAELEAVYEDLVETFVTYQTNVALRSITQKPNADLVMTYIEQPDGSFHQFLLVDPRQPVNPADSNSIGWNTNAPPAKVTRYQSYLKATYKAVNRAVQRIIDAVGVDANGVPRSNILVVSDHGFEPFHTSVDMNRILTNAGIPNTKVRAVISGPAVNVYINLKGREPNGIVEKQEFISLQKQVAALLKNYADTNANYTNGAASVPVFDKIYLRPADPNSPTFGRDVSPLIGQDGGDVFAMLTPGYNFDGVQNVTRKGDPAGAAPILTVPTFYGAHGYDPAYANLSAIFYAAGPDIGKATFMQIRNIDVAPTIEKLLGVTPAPTVQGRARNLKSTPLVSVRAASRKTHGALGDFDIVLPGVECRRAGTGNTHRLIVTFNNNVTAGTAAVTAGTGTVSGTSFVGNDLIIDLTGVTDAQNLTVQVSGVTDVWGNTLAAPLDVTLGVLLGDVNGDRTVNAADVTQVRTAASTASTANLRNDVVVNGLVNVSDVGQTQARVGNSIP